MLLATTGAGRVLADGGLDDDGCFGGPHQHGFRNMTERLGLTDAQREQARTIFQTNRTAMAPTLERLRTERQKLRTLLHADTVDEAAIRAETATMSGIMADLNVNRAKTGQQFRAILTPAQLATLRSLEQNRMNRDNCSCGGRRP
jgi:Spy/CpxP family protein refolding chaperone